VAGPSAHAAQGQGRVLHRRGQGAGLRLAQPRGYAFPIEGRGYLDPSEIWLAGKDQFFGRPVRRRATTGRTRAARRFRSRTVPSSTRARSGSPARTSSSARPARRRATTGRTRAGATPLDRAAAHRPLSSIWLSAARFAPGSAGEPRLAEPARRGVPAREPRLPRSERDLALRPGPVLRRAGSRRATTGRTRAPLRAAQENRGFVDPSEIWLFAAAQPAPFAELDWPNPRGAIFSRDLRGFLQALQLQFYVTPNALLEWPNPRGRPFAIELRTFVNALSLELAGRDQFFAAPGEAPRYDYPNPRGKPHATDLRTFLFRRARHRRAAERAGAGRVRLGRAHPHRPHHRHRCEQEDSPRHNDTPERVLAGSETAADDNEGLGSSTAVDPNENIGSDKA
jgi:hypothetical protein